jgi:hypothetical protein
MSWRDCGREVQEGARFGGSCLLQESCLMTSAGLRPYCTDRTANAWAEPIEALLVESSRREDGRPGLAGHARAGCG